MLYKPRIISILVHRCPWLRGKSAKSTMIILYSTVKTLVFNVVDDILNVVDDSATTYYRSRHDNNYTFAEKTAYNIHTSP